MRRERRDFGIFLPTASVVIRLAMRVHSSWRVSLEAKYSEVRMVSVAPWGYTMGFFQELDPPEDLRG